MNLKGKNWQLNSNLCPTDLDVAVEVFLTTVLKLLESNILFYFIFFPGQCRLHCCWIRFMSGWLCSFSCQLLRFLLMNNADGSAACPSCNMQCEQPLRNVNLFTTQRNLSTFTEKRENSFGLQEFAENKVVFHASRSRAHLASRRQQTSAVSVPFIFIESAMRVWWWGRAEMDHRGRIDETGKLPRLQNKIHQS